MLVFNSTQHVFAEDLLYKDNQIPYAFQVSYNLIRGNTTIKQRTVALVSFLSYKDSPPQLEGVRRQPNDHAKGLGWQNLPTLFNTRVLLVTLKLLFSLVTSPS